MDELLALAGPVTRRLFPPADPADESVAFAQDGFEADRWRTLAETDPILRPLTD